MPREKESTDRTKWQKKNTAEGSLYTYVSDSDTRTCLFKNDMTVEVRVDGILSNYPSEAEIAEMEEVDELLESIQTARLCAGVKEGYNCPVTLFQRSKLANQACIRCGKCQRFHQILRRRQMRKRKFMDVSGESEADRACIVQGCPGRDSGSIRLFPIPEHDIEAWCENLRLETSAVNPDMRVCSRHFEDSFKNPRTLKWGARPTLNLAHNDSVREHVKNVTRPTPHNCCIMGCNTTSPPDTLFCFPANKERLKEWLLICVIKNDMIGTKQKYICRKHFEPSMFHDTKLKKKVLKKDAIPKMDVVSWLENNTNTKIDDLSAVTAFKRSKAGTSIKLPPEVQALSAIGSVLISKLDVEDDIKSEHKSNSFEGLQCKNICITCAKAFKDCESYREACYDLEEQLQELHTKTEELKNQNEILMAELESNIVVYEEEIQCD